MKTSGASFSGLPGWLRAVVLDVTTSFLTPAVTAWASTLRVPRIAPSRTVFEFPRPDKGEATWSTAVTPI